MAVYVVTGKLGSGKTLITVSRIREYLLQGRPVATNLNLDLVAMLGPWHKPPPVYRLPDKPTRPDLDALGRIEQNADEEKNGLIVLDECGTWFNAREWNDPGRKALFNWFVHARKLGWDVIFIVQDISILDKQAREAFAEHVVYCRRLDRVAVPFLSALGRLFGVRMRGPKIHMAIVRYGDSENSLVVDRWMYRGTDLYRAYDTRQVFIHDPEQSVFCLLPPYLSRGRYFSMSRVAYALTRSRRWFMRHPFVVLVLGAAFAAPAYAAYFMSNSGSSAAPVPSQVTISPPAATLASPRQRVFRIRGGAYTGADSVMVLQDETGAQYTTDELRRAGHKVVVFNSCNISIHTPDRHVYLATCALLAASKAEGEGKPGPLSQFLPPTSP